MNRVRRPELIINFMTYTLLGSYRAKDYKSINESLGTEEWQGLITKYKDEGLKTPVEKAFLETFINQLKRLGYHIPTPIQIKSTKANNTLYYLIWATNEGGYKIIEEKVVPYLLKNVLKKHKMNKNSLIRVEAEEKGNSSLDKWF